jgi:hypothetical protein
MWNILGGTTMNIEEATRLERHILRDMPAWKPQARQIGNGEWVVKLANQKIVWSAEDWNVNFVGQPVQQEEQEVFA